VTFVAAHLHLSQCAALSVSTGSSMGLGGFIAAIYIAVTDLLSALKRHWSIGGVPLRLTWFLWSQPIRQRAECRQPWNMRSCHQAS
jgi:hypothetical protein